MRIALDSKLPNYPEFREGGIRRAPDRGFSLSPSQTEISLRNALRYIPSGLHEQMAPEFLDELKHVAGFMDTAIVPKVT